MELARGFITHIQNAWPRLRTGLRSSDINIRVFANQQEVFHCLKICLICEISSGMYEEATYLSRSFLGVLPCLCASFAQRFPSWGDNGYLIEVSR